MLYNVIIYIYNIYIYIICKQLYTPRFFSNIDAKGTQLGASRGVETLAQLELTLARHVNRFEQAPGSPGLAGTGRDHGDNSPG